MFYESLIAINKKFNLPLPALQKVNEELTAIKPNDIVSPRLISRRTHLPKSLVEEILMSLSYNSYLGVKYIIFCTNVDPDMVHAHEFTSKKSLTQFIIHNGYKCPDCGSSLNVEDIRVVFVMKEELCR